MRVLVVQVGEVGTLCFSEQSVCWSIEGKGTEVVSLARESGSTEAREEG